MFENHKNLDGKKKPVRQGDPVDAEELSRRLTAHLAEEKAKSERCDARTRRSAAFRGRRDPKIRERESIETASTLEKSTSSKVTQNNPRIIHKISRPLLKYHRHLENKFYESKRKANHQLSPDSSTLNPTKSKIRYGRKQYQRTGRNSIGGHEQELERKIYHLKPGIFRIHTILRRKSGCGWASGQTSTGSRDITVESSRNLAEPRHLNSNNSIWLSPKKKHSWFTK